MGAAESITADIPRKKGGWKVKSSPRHWQLQWKESI